MGRALGTLEELGVELLWFDSMGAKSASICVRTGSSTVVVDPGAAAMQPSYPLPPSEKRRLRREAVRAITRCWEEAGVVVVTHYHYDHHIPPGDPDLGDAHRLFLGKTLVLKNPNTYINESQWRRAREFIARVLELAGDRIENHFEQPRQLDFPDPVEELSASMRRDFGDYAPRRRELLEKGRAWFRSLVEKLWSRGPWVSEVELPNLRILWGEGRVLELGGARIRVLGPWFHGIEYDRTGWVTPLVIEVGGRRVFYTSDLMGPQIDDYAYAIARERPRVVIADGPPTYLFPYMLNRVNLRRAVENMVYIVENSGAELVIYDHHLLREKRWRERVSEVFRAARRVGVEVLTAAEYMGRRPLIDTLA